MISKVRTSFPFNSRGTFPDSIACVNPTTTLVLPIPGDPSNTQLLFFLQDNISITCEISFSLPITGSNCPDLHCLDKLVEY